MKSLVNTYFGIIFKIALIGVILSTLFLLNNLTTDFYETPKFLVLLAFCGLFLILLPLKFTLENKLTFVRTPLDIPLLLLLVVAVISTIMSASPFVSLLGLAPKVHTSLISIIVYIIFYFLLVNNLKHGKETKIILFISLGAAVILSLVSLASYFGVKVLPFAFTQVLNFTPTGSSFSSAAVLAMLLPLAAIEIFTSHNLVNKLIYTGIVTLFGVTIALIGSLPVWIAAVAAFALTFFATHRSQNIRSIKTETLLIAAIPILVVGLTFVLSFVPPAGSLKNPLFDKAKNFPREIQIPFITSWKVSVSSFRDSPFWGSGPSTYLYNFTNYKPLEFNSSKFWNLRFDTPFNEYLGAISTLGGIGFIALLSLTAMFLSSFFRSLKSTDPQVVGLGIAGVIFFIVLALHASSLVVWVIGLLILAAFFVLSMPHESVAKESSGFSNLLLKMTSPESSKETIKIEALPAILLVVCAALILITFFFAGKFTLADYHHRKAVVAVTKNDGVGAYNELVIAEKLNPYNDLYRTDLAQTNFALANAIATAKAPSETNPGGSLTDQDRQNIQILLQQSINEGRTAVTLSPRSATNWEILGLLYRQIAGVAENALAFSLDSYGRAIFQDPLNPALRLSVGGTYYAIKNYDLAIRFFTDAINLKPDFANGYYNLSVALKDKGDLNSAVAAAQKAVELVDKNSNDYKVATDYLNELKDKTSEGSTTTPPAAQAEGALKEEKLPKVIDLPKPSNIATPSAVKKPNSTPEPSATP